jgi:arylsulfatase A
LTVDPKFTTLAEVLQTAGYATGIFGKWHVGDVDGQRPLDRGFDEHHGIYYSNDMWRFHPTNPGFWSQFPLVYWENDKPKVADCGLEDQDQFTTWLTEAAVDFIHRHADQPFFCYVPHPQPHVPLHVSDKFRGKSGHDLYGDVIMEIDWSLGQIMSALEENGLIENTLVLFTSDNGPWLGYGTHAGTTPFREGKSTSFDGGVRSACVIHYPAALSAGGHSTRVWSSVDILPTFARMADAPLPEGELDGHDVWSIISGHSDEPHPGDYIEISRGPNFEGIITYDGKWKLHVPHPYQTVVEDTLRADGIPGQVKQAQIGYALFDMINDPTESTNVINDHPEVAAQLIETAEKHRQKWFPNQAPFSFVRE